MSQDDRIRGVLFGQAVGDGLGLFGEFKSAGFLRATYGEAGPDSYRPVNRTQHGWKAGEWSDDTEQALCLLDAYLADGDIVATTLATNFQRWAHEDGRGMGNHTWSVLSNGYFTLDPLNVSKDIWERSGKRSAPNGGVMRTSVMGILRPQDLDWTERAAATACRVTHWDPKCVGGAVALSVAIACLTQGWDIPDAIEEGLSRGEVVDPDVRRWAMMGLDELQLDEGLDPVRPRPPIGFTHKCMGAGFYALWELDSGTDFDTVLRRVIMAGGDTDTNGAVAGACMGAVVGLSGLPPHLVNGLHYRKALDDRLDRLLAR